MFCNSPHADSCLVYFTKRFPKLLSHVYKTVEANASDLFPHYFEKSEDRPDNFEKPDRSKMNDKVSFVMDKLDPKLRLEFNKVELKGIDCSNKYDELLDFIEAHQNMINEVVFIESKLTMSFLNKFLNKLPYLRILRFHETNPLNENEKVSHFRPNLIQLKEVEVKNCIGCLEILPKTLDLIRYNSATITKSFVNLIAKQIILHSLEITTDMDINSTRDYKLPSFQLKSLFLKDLSLNELTCTNWIFELARTQNEIENFSLFLTRRTCNQVILKFLSHIMNLSTLTYFDTNINPLIWRYAKPNKNTKQVVLKILLTEGLLYRRFKLNLDKFFPNLTKLELNDLHGHRISHLVPLKLKSLNKLKYLKELGLQNLQMDILIWLGDLDLPELTLFHTSWVIDEMDENFIDLNVNWEQCIGPFFDRSPKIKNLSIQLKSNLNFNLYKNQKMFTDLVSFVLGKLELIEHLEIVENIDYSWFSKVINESNVAEAEFLEEVIKCMFSNSFLKKWKLLQYESET